MKKIVITFILSLLYLSGFAQEKKEAKIDYENCKPTLPNPKHFGGDVGSKSRYEDPEGYIEYWYQKMMYECACVDLKNMSEAEIGERLRKWWDLYKYLLIVDSLQFNVTNGSVFKYAIYGGVT